MKITGKQLIGQNTFEGTGLPIQSLNSASAELLEPIYRSSSIEDTQKACFLADTCFHQYRDFSIEERAVFLETIAFEIEEIGDSLIQRAMLESGLPRARLEGERGRTCGQLRHFAQVVRSGEWLNVQIDSALPLRQPLPRTDLRQRHIPMGPVAVFGASNFPLAFSVAGGDTASALAAGCPVIVKAHSAHLGTSELVGKAVQAAVTSCGMPEGVFSLLYDAGFEVGQELVSNKFIQAVGFTGSREGGMALKSIAQARPVPIPVYAEMSSINPVFLLPNALKNRGKEIAENFVASMTMGAGQFCTNPGLIVAERSVELDKFLVYTQEFVAASSSQTMLTSGIYDAYKKGVEKFIVNPKIQCLAKGQTSDMPNQCQPQVFKTTARDFIDENELQSEIFGAASVIVECDDRQSMLDFAKQIEGQLTVTLQYDDADLKVAELLLPTLEQKAGRILFNGWPTGVEVSHAMVHGGPFPATTDSQTTSVGSAAINRFLRPVCYQNVPSELIPLELRDENPCGISRFVDGKRML